MMRTLLNFFFDKKQHRKYDEPPSYNYPTEVPPSLYSKTSNSRAKAEDKAWQDLNKACKLLASIVFTCIVAWIFFALSLIFER